MHDGDLKLQPAVTPESRQGDIPMLHDRIKQQPCMIGTQGFCCKLCMMGPCRVLNDSRKSACGASRDLLVAKNILRFAVGGAAAHVSHARHLLSFNPATLREPLSEDYIRRKAPGDLYNKWRDAEILPSEHHNGHLGDMAEAVHMTTLGVNSDYGCMLTNCLKIGLIDGYYGLYMGTELEERNFGGPVVQEGNINLGCIRPDRINIAIHGHDPALAEYMAQEAARYDEINLVGVCCTGSFLLGRYGVPIAAHFLLQEDVICTGMIEAMVVDVQCIMPSVADLCDCYHTRLISTNKAGRFPNATHMPVTNPVSAAMTAREIIEIAVQNRENRRSEQEATFDGRNPELQRAVVGHSEQSVPTREIADAIRHRKLKGVIAVIGCSHPRVNCEEWINVYRELSADYVVLSSGCMAFEFGRHGLLDGRKVFHMGSCINNARIAETFFLISQHLGEAIYNLPFIVSAPAPFTEKAISIALFFAALGCSIHSGFPYLFTGAPDIANFFDRSLSRMFGSKIYFEDNPSVFMTRVLSNFN